MGILDDLLGSEKKDYKENPQPIGDGMKGVEGQIRLSIRFLPLRLSARQESHTDMLVTVVNKGDEKQLLSFEAFLPPKEMIGFDRMAMSKHFEKKLGHVEPGATSEFAVPIHGTNQTKAGGYQIGAVVNVHFVDYTKVMPTGLKRKIVLRVV